MTTDLVGEVGGGPPMVAVPAVLRQVLALDHHTVRVQAKDWQESDHPRDDHGRFGEGGGTLTVDPGALAAMIANGGKVTVPAQALHNVLDGWAHGDSPVNMARMQVLGAGASHLFAESATDLPREAMPVVPANADGMAKFGEALAAAHVGAAYAEVDPRSLVATQNELDGRKVGQMLERLEQGGGKFPDQPTVPALVVSKDGEILDGHHRWASCAAYAMGHPGYKVPILRCDTDIHSLLKLGWQFDEAEGIAANRFGQDYNKAISFGQTPDSDPPDDGPWLWVGDRWVLVASDTADGVPRKLTFPDGGGRGEKAKPAAPHRAASQYREPHGAFGKEPTPPAKRPAIDTSDDPLDPRPKASPKQRGGWQVALSAVHAQHPELSPWMRDGDKVHRFGDGHVEAAHVDGTWTEFRPKPDGKLHPSRRYVPPPPEPDPFEGAPVTAAIKPKVKVRWEPEFKEQDRDDSGRFAGTDAREVSTVLRRGGFTPSKTSGSRIRGAPNRSHGFNATTEKEPTYDSRGKMRPASMDRPTGAVKVEHALSFVGVTDADAHMARAVGQADRYQAHLEANGFHVERLGNPETSTSMRVRKLADAPKAWGAVELKADSHGMHDLRTVEGDGDTKIVHAADCPHLPRSTGDPFKARSKVHAQRMFIGRPLVFASCTSAMPANDHDADDAPASAPAAPAAASAGGTGTMGRTGITRKGLPMSKDWASWREAHGKPDDDGDKKPGRVGSALHRAGDAVARNLAQTEDDEGGDNHPQGHGDGEHSTTGAVRRSSDDADRTRRAQQLLSVADRHDSRVEAKFAPDQERDDHGRFGSGGSGVGGRIHAALDRVLGGRQTMHPGVSAFMDRHDLNIAMPTGYVNPDPGEIRGGASAMITAGLHDGPSGVYVNDRGVDGMGAAASTTVDPAGPQPMRDGYVPSSQYGMLPADGGVMTDPKVWMLKGDQADKDIWDHVPVTEVPTAGLTATEDAVKLSPIDKVVSGREPFREGYDPKVYINRQGQRIVIDGHHRVAMHTALGHDTMRAKVIDAREMPRKQWDGIEAKSIAVAAAYSYRGMWPEAKEWNEADHPRADDGKFGAGGGSSSSSAAAHDDVERFGADHPVLPKDEFDARKKAEYDRIKAGGSRAENAAFGKAVAMSRDLQDAKKAMGGAATAQDAALAERVIAGARTAEPRITEDMVRLLHSSTYVDQHGKVQGDPTQTPRLEGLDFRLKAAGSMGRKFSTDSDFKNLTQPEKAARINDAIRYTALFSADDYAARTAETVDKMKGAGYTLDKVKNTWDPSNPYRGINTTWTDPNGHKFELQFHTPDSVDVKERVHAIYDGARLLPKTSADPRQPFMQAATQVTSEKLGPSPRGVGDLPSCGEDKPGSPACGDTYK